jgi:hypothetical protein
MHLLILVYFEYLFVLNFSLVTVPALEMLFPIVPDLCIMYIHYLFKKQGPPISQWKVNVESLSKIKSHDEEEEGFSALLSSPHYS